MNKKSRLVELNNRLKEITPIVSKSFKTSEELQQYKNENNSFYIEAKEIYEEIEQLKWELLSPEEKAEKVEQDKMYKLKREGKLFEYLANKNKK